GIVAGLLAVVAAAPYAARHGAEHLASLHDSEARLDGARRRGAAIDAAHDALFACMKAKEDIAADLVAGRLSPTEALARFQAADAGRPAFIATDLSDLAGSTLAERYVTCLLVYVADLLPDQPGREERLARLSAELRAGVRP